MGGWVRARVCVGGWVGGSVIVCVCVCVRVCVCVCVCVLDPHSRPGARDLTVVWGAARANTQRGERKGREVVRPSPLRPPRGSRSGSRRIHRGWRTARGAVEPGVLPMQRLPTAAPDKPKSFLERDRVGLWRWQQIRYSGAQPSAGKARVLPCGG